MPTVRLVSLWVSQVARTVADWCLRIAAVAALAACGFAPSSAWQLATIAFIAPFILLAPLNGYLSNSLPRRRVLVGSAAFIVAVVLPFAVVPAPGGQWVWLLALTACATAIYQAARYAVLPAAAQGSRIPLPRVNGWMEMGAAAAILGGIVLGGYFVTPGQEGGLIGALLGLNGLCLATAWFVSFPSDTIRPEPLRHAVAGFCRDVGRIGRDRPARGSLLGLASFQALVTAGTGVLLADALAAGFDQAGGLPSALLLAGAGAVAGCALAALQAHPVRNLGLVPFGAVGLLLTLIWGWWSPGVALVPALLLGFTGALVNVPLRSAYLAAVPADARGNATAVMNTAIYVGTSLLALALYAMPPGYQYLAVGLLALAGVLLSVTVLFRPGLENIVECLVWPIYRIRGHGPGVGRMPLRGPLLVVSNHSAYADPFWVGKVIPRSIVPMMTSVFYDLPVLRWLMVHLIGAIRVEAAAFRREAPELTEAVAHLRRGECLVIFPEGRLRSTEEVALRPFGQGVWHILREVPETVVVVLWIEGGWGSWLSYFNGRPMKNKRIDWWRAIDVGIGEPGPLKPELLADHRSTRDYLHAACLACREYVRH